MRSEQSDEQSAEQLQEVKHRKARIAHRALPDTIFGSHSYLKQHNDDPKPFVWTKPADVILAKLDRLPVPSVSVSALAASGSADCRVFADPIGIEPGA